MNQGKAPSEEYKIAVEYLDFNLSQIGAKLKETNLAPDIEAKYAEAINLLEEILSMHSNLINSVSEESEDADEMRNIRFSLTKVKKLELISLIANI